MSDQNKPTVVNELRATAQLMTLEPGVFCLFHQGPVATDANGLPGVRISQAPGSVDMSGSVQISTFRDDGWLGGADSAALIRINGGRPGQVLVTVYQAQNGRDAPRLQVVRLTEVPPAAPPAQPTAPEGRQGVPPGAAMLPGAAGAERPGGAERLVPSRPQPPVDKAEVAVHVNRMGDVLALLGDWAGERGSRRWIEGFAVSPKTPGISPADIEYQAVLGRDWLSPWSEGGQYCGSRGMSLPLLGLRVRLRGAAADSFGVALEATFVTGATVGPVAGGEACETPDLAALESFRLTLVARAPGDTPAAKPAPGRKPERQPEPEKPAPRRARAAPAEPPPQPATRGGPRRR